MSLAPATSTANSSATSALEGSQAAARTAGQPAANRRSGQTGSGQGASSDFARLLQGQQWQAEAEPDRSLASAEQRAALRRSEEGSGQETDEGEGDSSGGKARPGRSAQAEVADTPNNPWSPLATRPLAASEAAAASAASASLRAAAAGRGHRAPGEASGTSAALAGSADALATEDAGKAAGQAAAASLASAQGGASDAALAAEGSRPGAATAQAVNPSSPQDGSLPSLQADAAAATTPLNTPADAPPAPLPEARASLEPTPGTPAFTEALGVQLSTWLESGVQHAVLELHPAELGPIDVRIALRDGQTQVDLAAEVASTRAALAEALPRLVEALGEVGLNLSGGAVSDLASSAGQGGQPGQGRQPGGDAASAANLVRAFAARGLDDEGASTHLAARPGAAGRSLLDLYA